MKANITNFIADKNPIILLQAMKNVKMREMFSEFIKNNDVFDV